MAATHITSMLSVSSIVVCLLLLSSTTTTHGFAPHRKCHKINAIYSLGDSIADTGNLIREGRSNGFDVIKDLPYGETTFGNATGRCSDGLLMIDYLATALGLPLVKPHLDNSADFTHGVNFAVAGATALSEQFFSERGVILPFTNSSLDVQFNWFKNHLSCSSKNDCLKKLKHALVLVGEIGGNDYNYIFFEKQAIDQVVSSIPVVVQKIIDTATEAIRFGAQQIVVPGNFPIGCMPVYLSAIQSTNPEVYDHNGCSIQLNNLAMLHNIAVQKALKQLRLQFPNVVIMYADYFQAFTHLINNAASLGFNEDLMLKACCGAGGGAYNFNELAMCGAPGTTVCKNPSEHINWDGIHLTQAAYKVMADLLINGHFTYPCCRIYY